MKKVKIGFIPSHRMPFGEQVGGGDAGALSEGDEEGPRGGDRRARRQAHVQGRGAQPGGREEDAGSSSRSKDVTGVIVGGMTFGQEVSAVGVIIAGLPKGDAGAALRHEGAGGPGRDAPFRLVVRAVHDRIGDEAARDPVRAHPDLLPGGAGVRAGGVALHARLRGARRCSAAARIGQLGVRPEEFESVWWDEASLQRDFNQTVVPIDLADIFMRLDEVRRERRRGEEGRAEDHRPGPRSPAEAKEFVTHARPDGSGDAAPGAGERTWTRWR